MTATVETQQFANFVISTRPNTIAAKLLQQFKPLVYPTYNFQDLGSPAPGIGVIGPKDGIPDIGTAIYVPDAFRNASQWSVRIDHELRPGKDRLFANYYKTHNTTLSGGIRPAFDRPTDEFTDFGSLNETHIFSPTMVNEFHAGIMRLHGQPWDLPQANLAIPSISLGSGVAAIGSQGQYPVGWESTNYNYKNIFSWIRSKHSIKIGGELRQATDIATNTSNYIPTYSFANILDFADDEALQETRSVDPRMGLPATTYCSLRGTEWSAFINDDWKVRRNLTLTIGLRYEYFGVLNPPQQEAPRNFVFGPGADLGQMVASGKVDIVPSMYSTGKKNFAPRFGFAWDIGGNGRTAIRGGYGLAYDRMPSLPVEPYKTNPPLRATATLGVQQGTPNFIYSLGDATKPYLGYPVDPLLKLGLNAQNGIQGALVAITGIDPNIRSPYVQNWSLGVQRTIGSGTIVEVNYIGSKGTHLFDQANINRYNGDMLSGSFKGYNPAFSSITWYESHADSVYHAGTVQVRRALAKDLSIQGSYTFGKSIDDTSGFRASQAMDGANMRAERAVSDYDVPQRLTFVEIWQLPIFRDKKTTLVGRVLGGWQLSGFGIFEKGLPVNVYTSAPYPTGDYNADGTNNDRPNAPAASVQQGGWNRSNYLTGIFTASQFPRPATGTDGSLGRNAYRGPGFAEIDLSLAKRIAITERVSTQIRLDAFNALNRVNLNNPVSDLSSGSLGRSTGTYTPRAFQAGLRVAF